MSSGIVDIATITDGDTIRIGARRIRLHGIDTPEQGSQCGSVNVYRAAADALREAIGNQVVTCVIRGAPDRRGREIAECSVGDTNLNEYLVQTGWARDWPRYSGGAYSDEEAQAREAEVGVWAPNCPANLWGNRDYSR